MSRLSCGMSYGSRKTARDACLALAQFFAIGNDPIGTPGRRASFALIFFRRPVLNDRLGKRTADPAIGGISWTGGLVRAFVAARGIVPCHERARALRIESGRQSGFRAAAVFFVAQDTRPWLDRARDIIALRHHRPDGIGNRAAATRQCENGPARQRGAAAQA